MLETEITELEAEACERIASALSAEALETVRVEVLGRKGVLAQISKDMGKLTPQERARVGKLLNAAKQNLEQALDARKKQFDEAALRARLEAEWVDLTLP